jgi:hypothetical protein
MPLIFSTSTSAGVTIYHGEVSHVVRVRVAGLEWMFRGHHEWRPDETNYLAEN